MKKNILLLTSLYPEQNNAQMNITDALHQFAIEWQQQNYNVLVIRPQISLWHKNFFTKKYIVDGIEIWDVPLWRLPKTFFPFTFNIKFLLKKKKWKPHAIVCHLIHGVLAGQRLSRYYKVPIKIGIHKTDIEYIQKIPKVKNIYHNIFTEIGTHNVSFRSPSLKTKLNAIFPDLRLQNNFCCLSGVDHYWFYKKTIEWKENERPIKFITVSRLIERKKIKETITALSKLPKKINWEYHIVGCGEEEQNLHSQVIQLSLEEKIHFHGFQSRQWISSQLRQMDIFIMVSTRETLGLVYLEAMASGCIVVGAKNWGIDGIISENIHGYLVSVEGNIAKNIEEKLNFILQSNTSQLELILANSHKLIQRFSKKHMAQLYLDFILDENKQDKQPIKKNILFLTSLYPGPNNQDLKITDALHQFVIEWKKHHHMSIIVIKPNVKYWHRKTSMQKHIIDNIEVWDFCVWRLPKIFYIFTFNIIHLLRKKKWKPDVVVCHHLDGILPGKNLAKYYKVPIKIGIHKTDIELIENAPKLKKIYKKTFETINKNSVSFRSPHLRLKMSLIFPQFHFQNNLCCISGIDNYWFYEKESTLNKWKQNERPVKIITVSRLIPLKNISQTIIALNNLKHNIKWEFHIVGIGPKEKNLRNLVTQLSLNKQVYFHGFQSRKWISNKLRETDIFIMVSAPETLGLAYLEAMASGCLVIGAKNWGIDGIIKNEINGYLVSVEGDIARNIGKVFSKIYNSKTSKLNHILQESSTTIKNFNKAKMVQLYLDFILDIE
ncbi:glycosyltransferase [Candidatus Uabimicrobium sp. HlEnr_7]|uniref:glycosyltransferase n=1 Tax=Candidatus Uabimicrobium helgolandensis TaxID=3095367 RepID=UPI003556BED5